jgi:signal transduction histidine kinase
MAGMEKAGTSPRRRGLGSATAWDALFAAVLWPVCVIPAIVPGSLESSAIRAAFITATLLALVFRRLAPTASGAAVLVLALVHLLYFRYVAVPGDLLLLISAYSVARHARPWAARLSLAAAPAGSAVFLGAALSSWVDLSAPYLGYFGVFGIFGADGGRFRGLTPLAAIGALTIAVAGGTAWSLGMLGRSRAAHRLALQERAEADAAGREHLADLAAVGERNRIAREMHDIVAHSLSVIIAQADGGRYAAAQDAKAAERALRTIADTGRAALGDMRRILGVLRNPDDAEQAEGGGPLLAPVPDDQDIGHLVEQMRATGLAISLARVGTARTLPPGAGLALFRVVQEALTNILKHAGPDVQVAILEQWQGEAITVEVSDDGRGAAAAGKGEDAGGHGLIGMRERVEMFGGALLAGPAPTGGFRIRARLPLPPRDDPQDEREQ